MLCKRPSVHPDFEPTHRKHTVTWKVAPWKLQYKLGNQQINLETK